MEILAKLNEMADKKSVTPAQLALAWVHAQVDFFIFLGIKVS